MLLKNSAKNKQTLFILLILFVSAFFTVRQPITKSMSMLSSVAVVLFAIPSYYAVIRVAGRAKGLQLLGLLGFYALLVESIALATGFPYGNFIYNDVLGNKILGLAPWTVAFAFPPIVFLAYWSVRRSYASAGLLPTVLLTSLLAMGIDLVLDPGAVRLGFWQWSTPGIYYGVPLVNFLGWILTSSVATMLIHFFLGRKKVSIGIAYSGLATLCYWTAVNAWLGLLLPSSIGIILLCLFAYQIHQKKGTL